MMDVPKLWRAASFLQAPPSLQVPAAGYRSLDLRNNASTWMSAQSITGESAVLLREGKKQIGPAQDDEEPGAETSIQEQKGSATPRSACSRNQSNEPVLY